MDVIGDGRKKAVSWYATNSPDEAEHNGDEDEVVVRRKSSSRHHTGKHRSLQPKQETLTTMTTALSMRPEQFEEALYTDVNSIDCCPEGSLPRRRSNYRIGKLNTRLLEAVENGDIAEIIRLLKQEANPNATCRLNHVSACHVAAMDNNDSLSLLIKAGAEVVRRDKLGRTPLHLAAWEGNSRQIAVLLDFPEELQHKVAFRLSRDTELELQELSMRHRLTNMPCNIGNLTPLPQSWTDSMEHNCRRIKENLPLFQPGWTALHSASARAQYTCVQLLLAAGAEPCTRDLIGRTPLDVVGDAYYSGHHIEVLSFRETIGLLLAAGSKFHSSYIKRLNNMNTPLHTAVELESEGAIEELLDAGASATCLNSNGLTAMHICVEKQLKELLQLLANYEYDDQDPYLATVDAKDKMGQTILHAAVRAKWADGVCIALGAGAGIFMKANDGESPIHCAAAAGDIHIIREILTVAKYAIDSRNQKGQTPLFVAVIHNHIDIVKLLVESGASIKHFLPDGQNVLHVVCRYGYVDILEYLLTANSRTVRSLINAPAMSHTPITYAAQNNHPACYQLLLWKKHELDMLLASIPSIESSVTGPDQIKWLIEFSQDLAYNELGTIAYASSIKSLGRPRKTGINKVYEYTTDLHIAAAKNHFEIARIILEFNSDTMNVLNVNGYLPLHEACIHGNREIISLLIHKGADLSKPAQNSKVKLTSIEMLMNNLSKPVEYMEEVFDSYVSSQGKNLQDKECQVTVNYDILMPNPVDGNQMDVIKALVDTGNRYGQRKLLQHPLVESFLYLKWKALLPFFYAIIVLYGLFVISLNVYVVTVFYYQDKNHVHNDTTNSTGLFTNATNKDREVPLYLTPEIWKYLVYVTVSLIALQEIIFIKLRNKRYFLFLETWVKFVSIALSIFLPSLVTWPVAVGESGTSPEWARLIATIALLLSWLELMFLLSRFPSWGFYVLMFGKVATKVFKILLTFMFLIIGFSLCFMVQFRAKSPFEEPWAAITKTLVMMTSEYDYMSMINKEHAQHITASILILRLVFISFVILASVVLMNLMIGVAVNNVNNLEEIGNQKRLEKQIEFLASLEDVVFNKGIRKFLPKKFHSTWSLRKRVKNVIVLKPSEATCHKIFPKHIREAIFERAQLQKKLMDDELGSMAYHLKLNEIHDAIVKQDEKVEPPEWMMDITMFNETVDKINRQIEGLRKEMAVIKQLMSRRYSTHY